MSWLFHFSLPALLAAIPGPAGDKNRQALYMLAAIAVVLAVVRIWRNRRSPQKVLISLLTPAGAVIGFMAIYRHDLSREARTAMVATCVGLEIIALVLRVWSFRKTPRTLLIFLGIVSILTAAHYGLQAATGKPANSPVVALATLVLALYLALVIWFVNLVLKQRRSVANLTSLAARLGWQMEVQRRCFGLLRLHILVGHHRGREVRFNSFTPPTTSKKQKFAGVVANLTGGKDLLIVLTPKVASVTPKASATVGVSDLTVNDPNFDQAFRVQTNNADFSRRLFSPEIRRQLLDLRRQKSEAFLVGIRGGKAFYATPGSYANNALVDRLAERIDLVCDLADQAERAATNPAQ